MNLKEILLPKLNKKIKVQDRQAMKRGHPTRRAKPHVFAPTLPIDWTKNNSLTYPMDGNDAYGDCMEAAACHGDNTFTGNSGTESVFDTQQIVNQYLSASGGDNGLDEGTLLSQCWKPGLAGVAAATYVDSMDVDPSNPTLVQQVIDYFGGLLFMLDVPDTWINNFSGNGGDIWDAPATADQNNGHGVWWAGVDTNGNYKLLTWGSWVWITPAGVLVCDPSAFVVFSTRWFNPATGLAPNGIHITVLAQYWQQMGGNAIPASVVGAFPPAPNPPIPIPPTPPSPPNPTPSGNTITVNETLSPGTYTLVPAGSTVLSPGDNQALEGALANINQVISDATKGKHISLKAGEPPFVK